MSHRSVFLLLYLLVIVIKMIFTFYKLNAGPPGLEASTLPLAYRGGTRKLRKEFKT